MLMQNLKWIRFGEKLSSESQKEILFKNIISSPPKRHLTFFDSIGFNSLNWKLRNDKFYLTSIKSFRKFGGGL
jgi:hypothetical protein